MLDLFIQVPKAVRSRLARRCKEVYECVRASQAVGDEDVDSEHAQQVCLHRHTQGARGWVVWLYPASGACSLQACAGFDRYAVP